MNAIPSLLVALATASTCSFAWAQTGPFDPEQWPPTIDSTKAVHFFVADSGLTPPGAAWLPNQLRILTGGDHGTADITIGGHAAKKATDNYLNVADSLYTEWADDEFIDILVQAYGDDALLSAEGQPRDFNFLTGVLPDINDVVGGQIPAAAKNRKWNWILFRVPNAIRPSDGARYVGSLPPNPQGDSSAGGVNGGTIRFQTVPSLIVRVVAFGAQGAFGEPEAINLFLPPDTCDPEPNTNLASIDINTGVADHMVVLDDGDQTVFYQDNVGPANDLRRAVGANGSFLNFGITGQYLGQPCNDPHAMKVCVEFYDDPGIVGAKFGPEAYATDDQGGIAIYPEAQLHVMQGSGEWVRRSWTIPAVSLQGVNAGAYTGGPRFITADALVFVSKVQLAVLRTGDHPLAGQDPLADCYPDPNICTDAYGRFAEFDLAQNLRAGLDVGSSGGDQEMIVEEAGPSTDRRLAVRAARDDGTPGAPHQYLNFAILNEALGPSSQPSAHIAICVTYYDNPELVGSTFRPEAYRTERNGLETFGFVSDSAAVALEGTDTWRTAYWEIPDVKFTGVNQAPQAAARFLSTNKVHIAAVQYAVIRPCGPYANVNLLEDCKPPEEISLQVGLAANQLQLTWPVTPEVYILQETNDLTDPEWSAVTAEPQQINENYTVQLPISDITRFFRLMR
ncbi:MAG: hypothetical protein KJ072_19230 [Verrucomicrobia bacterium]|nr:hypothetical protein [Verrucomicrobiota bacterium]